MATPSGIRPHILIVGGGYVGMYAGLRLQKKLRPGEATITVVDPQSYMTYQPFLPEAAAGNLEPRHVVVPLRRVLPKARIVNGAVTAISHAARVATVQPLEGAPTTISYDLLVYAPGSVARTLPIPGLAEEAIGFRTVAEAIYLRNHVLARLDAAASTDERALRRRLLTFTFIGGGYAGIEAIAELEDMARDAMKYYPNLTPADARWVMVEASGRILPEVSESLSHYTIGQLGEQGIDVLLNTRVTSVVGGHVQLDNGESFESDTVVWTAGVKPNPLVQRTDLPADDRGRVRATAYLNVDGLGDAFTAGDCAAVPDLTKGAGAFTGPSAQHAVRQAKLLADNVLAAIRGDALLPYEHSYAGSVASLGLHRGVAEIYGIKLRGYPAWFMHRTYHLSRMPTFNRKVRVAADWTLALFFRREIVSLGALQNPRRDFRAAAALPAEEVQR